MGGDLDPLINPTRTTYRAEGAVPLGRTSVALGGVRVESLSGNAGAGANTNGLVGAVAVDDGRSGNDGTEDPSHPVP